MRKVLANKRSLLVLLVCSLWHLTGWAQEIDSNFLDPNLLATDGTAVYSGRVDYSPSPPPHGSYTWPTPSVDPSIITKGLYLPLAAGGGHTCGAKADETIWCWGRNNRGQLGNAAFNNSPTPTAVRDVFAQQISIWPSLTAGGTHSCGISRELDAQCWGDNGWDGGFGQLGDGRTFPQTTAPVWVNLLNGGLRGVQIIEAGTWHTCAVKRDNTLHCWGYNSAGQLGDGGFQTGWSPVQVKGPNGKGWLTGVRSVAAGNYHTCAVRDDGINTGTIWCWGANFNGQRGDPDRFSDRPFPGPDPVKMNDGTILQEVIGITAGHDHTCAVKKDGSIWCWGANFYGQLGNGMVGDLSTSPVKVANLLDAVFVSAGRHHTCALKRDPNLNGVGSVWCWGDNHYGQAGDGTNDPQKTVPVQVRDFQGNLFTQMIQLVAGHYHNCARQGDASVWCWGSNGNGQLGDGTQGEHKTTAIQVKFP